MKSAFSQSLSISFFLILALFGLFSSSANAANTILSNYNYNNAYWHWSTVSTNPNDALVVPADSVCKGPARFDYYAGAPGSANYVTPDELNAALPSSTAGTTYYLPIAFTDCKDVYGKLLFGDGVWHKPRTPWALTICNPGYSVTLWGNAYSCTVDNAAAVQIDGGNQQGAPVNCGSCLLNWLNDQAPNASVTGLMRGDPVNAANGNELQEQVDYLGAGANLISFVRTYNSGSGFIDSQFGAGWTHGYRYAAIFSGVPATSVVMLRPDGGSFTYYYNSTTQKFTGPPYAGGDLTGTLANGSIQQLVFTRNDGTKETYDYVGLVTSIAYAQGGTLTFAHFSSRQLRSITDGRGHQLTLSYATLGGTTRVSQMTAPNGEIYQYAYDSSGRLASATYPGGGVKRYAYMPATLDGAVSPFKDKLTQVLDENGATFASIAYDASGRAVSTQLGAGVELTTFVYGTNATTVTNSLGVSETMTFGTLVNRPQLQTTTLNCANDCGTNGLSDQFQYDANGNATAIIDKHGVMTCLAYTSTKNLPLKVVRGLAPGSDCAAALATPPVTSTVRTYQWHATLGVPLVVTGPLLKTVFTYDPVGRKLTQSEQETSDATGASGASASSVGITRVTTWSYNTQGSVLTVKEPRTDVNATTTFAYDANQNLTSITGPTGLVTTYANYDANGRAQLITAPNGLPTTLVYNARGLPASVTTAGAVTSYGYDAAGQLTSSALPSGVTLTFTYDTAHRLIATSDSLGNRVDRTLDTEGNVLQQTVTGNGGVLAHSRQAAYDQLSRTTSVTKAQ